MRNIIALILVLLIGSITLNFYLIRKVWKYYGELILLENNSLTFISALKPNNKSDKDINRFTFIGDSRANDWGQFFSGEMYLVTNYAINGITSNQGCLLKNYLSEDSFNIVIVQIGVNDLKAIGLYPDLKESVVKNCYKNISDLTDYLLLKSKFVVLTTLFPVPKIPLIRRLFWNKQASSSIIELNDLIRSKQSDKLIIMDPYRLLADDKGRLPSVYTKDFLHLNKKGYEYLSHELRTILQQKNILNKHIK